MEAVGPVFEVCKCIWGPISRRIGYVKNLNRNFERLTSKVRELHAEKEDVKRKINGKRPTNVCELWLEKVDELQKKWTETEAEYQTNVTCLGGWCPNVFSRLNLGKRVVELTTEIEEKSEFKGELVIDEPEKIMPMPKPRPEVNTAMERTLQELLGTIKKGSKKRIGLWGMGGIGKTTIMKLLLDRPDIKHMFDIVLWVVVSKEGTNRTVQDKLAQRLGVEKPESKSNEYLQSKVCERLKGKKFLLLLDDVWDDINLEEVGVPLADEEGEGCKVVLSSRFLSVCRKMRTENDIEVKALSEEEAWSLFGREAGEMVNDSRIEALAREVAKECCGLPLAIVVVGGALRNVPHIHVWRNAVQELRSPVSNEIEDMEDRVYRPLKYSYDRLKDERSKECFLSCALFPEDWEIPKVQLTQYWINEGLIVGWDNLEAAKDKGFSKLEELMDASLLQKGEFDRYVKMHDVMRDLALRILSPKADGNCKSFVYTKWWGKFYSEEVSVEISMLNKLTHLLFTFSKIEHLHHFIRQSSSWKRRSLTTFRFAIGQEIDYLGYDPMESSFNPNPIGESKGMIAYDDDTKLKNVSGEIRQILTRVDTLAVGHLAAVQRLSEFGLENMNELKCCFVNYCEGMETIISMHDDEDRDNGKKQNSDLLPSLKVLHLFYLPNLKSCWELLGAGGDN